MVSKEYKSHTESLLELLTRLQLYRQSMSPD